jgi:transcription factor TGA
MQHVSPAGALAFDKDYAGWEDEHRKQISELRAALSAHAGDDELRRIVDGVMAHHHEAFRLKCVAARADAFHVLSGMWKTPVERCFMWLGGFRPSEILKVVYG